MGVMVATGGLMSYGADTKALYRAADLYIDKILKGTKGHEARFANALCKAGLPE